jgi:hypothetical protein
MTPMRSDKEILTELESASKGLLVMSESDYPFEIVSWDGKVQITSEFLRSISGKPDDSTIEEVELDSFLNASGQFGNLAKLLKDKLSDPKVYKVGTINIPVYIIGRSAEGNWLGLSTRLVQT